MHSDLISVIVPVYNVELYLKECVDSILAQSYSDIEIILVNDGSTDGCADICDDYKRCDNRVKVIHKKNGGLSSARNAGLTFAKGEYVTFVDSDDYIDKDFLKNLHNAIVENEAQISICDYKNFETGSLTQQQSNANITLFTNVQALKNTFQPEFHGMEFIACGKLYKTSLFLQNRVEFPLGKLHEDMFTTYKVMYFAQKIVFVDYIGYYYRVRQGSIMHSSFDVRRLAAVEASLQTCEFFEKHNERELLSYAFNAHLRTMVGTYKKIDQFYVGEDKAELKRKMHSKYKEDLKKYKSHVDLPYKNLVFYTLFAFCPCKILLKLI